MLTCHYISYSMNQMLFIPSSYTFKCAGCPKQQRYSQSHCTSYLKYQYLFAMMQRIPFMYWSVTGDPYYSHRSISMFSHLDSKSEFSAWPLVHRCSYICILLHFHRNRKFEVCPLHNSKSIIFIQNLYKVWSILFNISGPLQIIILSERM